MIDMIPGVLPVRSTDIPDTMETQKSYIIVDKDHIIKEKMKTFHRNAIMCN